MDYYKRLLERAWQDTWDVVFNAPWISILATGLVFLVTILIHWQRKGIAEVREGLVVAAEGAVATIIVFLLVFAVHFLVFTPKRLYESAAEQAANKPTVSPDQSRIRLDVADAEGREELKKTKEELEQAKATIRSLDPLQQPIASVTIIADVIIQSERPFNSHFMDSGGAVGFVRGSEVLLTVFTGDSHAKTVENQVAAFHAVFNPPIHGPLVGKPVTELGTAQYLQLELKQLPENAPVLRGTIVVTVNGTQRFELQVPSQTAKGVRIIIQDLHPMRTKMSPSR